MHTPYNEKTVTAHDEGLFTGQQNVFNPTPRNSPTDREAYTDMQGNTLSDEEYITRHNNKAKQ